MRKSPGFTPRSQSIIGPFQGAKTRCASRVKRHQTGHLLVFVCFVRSQTLYPTELRAHPWDCIHFALLTLPLQLLIRPIFWNTLEHNKREFRIPRPPSPLPPAAFQFLRRDGSTVPTSSRADGTKSGAEGGGSEQCLRTRLRGSKRGSSAGQKRAVGDCADPAGACSVVSRAGGAYNARDRGQIGNSI